MDKEAFLRSLLPRMDYVKCKECNKTLIAPMVRPLSLIQDWGFSTMVTLHIAWLQHNDWHIPRQTGDYICPECWKNRSRDGIEEYEKIEREPSCIEHYQEYIRKLTK